MKTINVRVTLTEDMLGSSPSDKEIYKTFIASKAPDADGYEEEVAANGIDATYDKGVTVFPRDAEGRPCIWDYQIKGFCKDACQMLSRAAGKDENGKKLQCNESSKLRAYKKDIDGLVFVAPRMIPINVNGKIGICERPLRAMTMQGERVALAASESVPAGSTFEFQFNLLRDDLEKAVIEWLDYTKLRGFGQWRNSGKGRARYEILDYDVC